MIGRLSETAIANLFESLGLHPAIIPGGEVEVQEEIPDTKLKALRNLLRREQFDILFDKSRILSEKVMHVIMEMIHYSREMPAINYSEYISQKLCMNYTFLSKCFSRNMGITIEQFIIMQKIERVKKLLRFPDITLTEIAWKLQYSSTAHLSTQFKRVTGLTPSIYRKSTVKH
jgi:AraC-like DNA-binding protein